jgi:hypothetical protein
VAVAGGAEAHRAGGRPPDLTGLRAPLGFEPNRGQAAAEVEFLARGRSYVLALTRGDAVLTVGRVTVRMRPVGANTAPEVAPQVPLPGRVNYLTGRDPIRWRTGIPTYARVVYRDVYPAIDLVYHGDQSQLEYDFVVAPGADPATIRLAFDGADGLALDDDGALRLTTSAGALVLPKPTLYQERDGVRKTIAGGYVLQGTGVAFWTAPYDRTRPLVIDPVLSWSSYLGGSFFDGAAAIAVDAAGAVYVTGGTTGGSNNPPGPTPPGVVNDFPATPGTVQPRQPACGPYPFWGCGDAFVAKLAGDGSGLLWATYLGGADIDAGLGIAVDGAGQVHVTGSTQSGNFPQGGDFPTTPGALFPTRLHGGCGQDGCPDGFIAKLSADGRGLLYASYLGGGNASGSEGAAIAVDGAGNAYVTGTYGAPAAATRYHFGAFVGYSVGVFVLKFGPDGALVYSADFGTGMGSSIAVDAAGHAYVTGTAGAGFPTVRARQPAVSGVADAFVAKLTPDGAALVYSTFLGGGASDQGAGIVVDAAGQAYVAGWTDSADFPTTPGALTAGGAGGAFVTKVAANGADLVYSAVIAGGRTTALAVDATGSAYLTGDAGPGFPTVDPVQAGPAGGRDAFVAKLNPSGSALVYSTHLGGSGDEFAGGIALGGPGTAYVVGETHSANFPTVQPFQAGLRGASDAFVVRLDDSASPPASLAFEVRRTAPASNPIAPGATQTIETHVFASAAASNILVDLEVYSAAGARLAQQVHGGQSFAAGQTQVYRWTLPLGAAFPAGTYTVKVGIFTGDWGHLYVWTNQAATFVVDPGGPPLPGPLAFAVGTALVTPDPVAPGGSLRIDVPITANAAASGILVDLGLYAAGGTRVAQRVFGSESFTAGQARTFAWTIDPIGFAAGTYTVKAGVFTAGWGSLFTWVDQVGTVTVGSGSPGPLTFAIGNAVVTPNPVSAGQTVRLDVAVSASAAASGILVDLELYDGAGAKVAQSVVTGQSFTAGQTRIYPWTIGPVSLPAGTYTVRAGIFSAGWSTLHTWDSDAGTLTVR